MDSSLLQNGGFTPTERGGGGGGDGKSFSHAEGQGGGGGANKFRGSFYAVAWSFSHIVEG